MRRLGCARARGKHFTSHASLSPIVLPLLVFRESVHKEVGPRNQHHSHLIVQLGTIKVGGIEWQGNRRRSVADWQN